VINRHPRVQMSLVKTRKSPITGAIVVADVVLRPEPGNDGAGSESEMLKTEILTVCQEVLPPHKIPTSIRFVPSLPVSGAGKLARS
jgi:acyl-coenzyme A synthetase/AMP-(fatty) acid ligase